MVLLLCAEQQNKTQPNVDGNHDLISQQWSAEMRMNYDLIVTQNIPSFLEITGYFLMGFRSFRRSLSDTAVLLTPSV